MQTVASGIVIINPRILISDQFNYIADGGLVLRDQTCLELAGKARRRELINQSSWSRSSQRSSGLGKRCHHPPPAYSGSLKPSLAKS